MARDAALVPEIWHDLDRPQSPAHGGDAVAHDHNTATAHSAVDDFGQHAQPGHRAPGLGRLGCVVHTTPNTAKPALDVREHHGLFCTGHAVWHDLFPARLTSSNVPYTITR